MINDQVVFKTVMDVCATEWLDISEAPDYFSFRCLIQFKEFGLSGPTQPYISTGWWSHTTKTFEIDARGAYKDFTPERFIPLYDDIKA